MPAASDKFIKHTSKRMTKLTTRYIELGEKLVSMKGTPKSNGEIFKILKEADENRKQWDELQAQITAVLSLKRFYIMSENNNKG